ncbi:MAG: GTPase ObgE, partial [Chitinivibrionales bacterium]|nr:GTPase ObgE [Chitinivibrionales bacterium]
GGRGGHIYIEGSHHLHTLQDTAHTFHYKAPHGMNGKGSHKAGKMAEDIVIRVPLGTVISDAVTGEIILDCLEEGQRVIVARGGRGGRGNAALVSKKDPLPDHAEIGQRGQKRKLRLVLKVLADVGLVGRPNAGKSTLLSTVSHARPKIAGYPFTTKQPFLGIVKINDSYDSFVMADIPGLIENSHLGRGLGIQFLKHIERTRVLAILVEATVADPAADADVLLQELAAYSPLLAEKPKIFIFTKIDMFPIGERPVIPAGWLACSAHTGEGIKEVIHALKAALDSRSEVL